MSKGFKITVATILVLSGLAYLGRDQLQDLYLDHKASQLVGNCYKTNDNMTAIFGIKSADNENNTLHIKGALYMIMPFEADVLRNAVFMDLQNGYLVQIECAE